MAERPQPLDGEPAARVLVAGASGFAGALAAELVWRHPRLELARGDVALRRGDADRRAPPALPGRIELTELDVDAVEECDAAIVAYPHRRLRAGRRRRSASSACSSSTSRPTSGSAIPTSTREWYGELAAPELLGEAVYGLTELYRDRIREAELVANPGCYPTATVLGLAPLAAAGLIDDVVVDAKSGVSGRRAGRRRAAQLRHPDENASPYGVGGHRHEPEIAQELGALAAGEAPPLTFVPHLLPLDQGELVSCYVRPSRRSRPTR